MRAALALGVDWVEVDVRLVDGVPVAFHDEGLERTTDGRGTLHALSFEALRALDAGGGERVPTLAEVIDVAGGRAGVNVELKDPGCARAVVALVRRYIAAGVDARAFLISAFDHGELAVARSLDPELRIGVLWDDAPPPDHLQLLRTLQAYSEHVPHRAVIPGLARELHAAGVLLLAYTVNTPENMARVTAAGADGVFTDDPTLCRHDRP